MTRDLLSRSCGAERRATKQQAVYHDPLPPETKTVDWPCPLASTGLHECIASLGHDMRHCCRCGLTWGWLVGEEVQDG